MGYVVNSNQHDERITIASGTLGGSAIDSAVEEGSEARAEMGRLRRVLDECHERVTVLEKVAAPVMRQLGPDKSAPPEIPRGAADTPLSGDLRSLADQADHLRKRLSEVVHRISV